jgi:hypothetical protein
MAVCMCEAQFCIATVIATTMGHPARSQQSRALSSLTAGVLLSVRGFACVRYSFAS